MSGEYFTIDEACELLRISRPTLNAYRDKHSIKHYLIRGKVYYKKLDMLNLYSHLSRTQMPEIDLTVLASSTVDNIEVTPNVFDLRLIRTIDAFGAMCLFCCFKSRARKRQHVYLLVGVNAGVIYLKGMDFFQELKVVDTNYVHYDDDALRNVPVSNSGIMLPFTRVSYRGAEKHALEKLNESLRKQGFSENMLASLGWVVGELADNATTHAEGPCFFTVASSIGPIKSLTATIGDVGVGIPVTLKSKERYKNLEDVKAFISAFKSDVSSWDDEHKRGKGLNDILSVAKGNKAWLRAESNGKSVLFDFSTNEIHPELKRAGTDEAGTRYSIMLTDSQFDQITKKEMNELIDRFMETL